MSDSVSVLEGFLASGIKDTAVYVLGYLPRIAAAILVLVLGWLLSRAIRALTIRAIGKLDQWWQRLIAKRGLMVHMPPRHPPTRIVGELLFWLLMLIFVTLATEILGLDIFRAWLEEIVSYLPLAMAGLLIVLVGFVVSSLTRDLVASAAATAELSHGDLLARTAQMIILFVAIVLGIDQIGIDIMFLSVMAGTILGTMLGSIALAFGLGARTHVSNIIAANQMRQIYQVGDVVSIGDIEGRIVEIRVSRVMVETEKGSVDIPAKLFDEQVTMIIEKGT